MWYVVRSFRSPAWRGLAPKDIQSYWNKHAKLFGSRHLATPFNNLDEAHAEAKVAVDQFRGLGMLRDMRNEINICKVVDED